jgi:Co/Zn/Cd efflux system component
VLLLTGGFMIAEFAVALWTGSLALLVDAGHIKIGPTAISSATAKMKF